MSTDLLPPEEDWRFHSTIYCLSDLSLWQEAEVALGILENTAAPEYWGENSIVFDDYSRKALRAHFAQAKPGDDRYPLVLKRGAPPRYRGAMNVGISIHPHSIHLDSTLRHAEGEVEQLFGTVDALVAGLNVEFASIDIRRVEQPVETRIDRGASSEDLKPYLRVGPQWAWIRTYIGPRLVALGGGSRNWHECGGIWRYFKNGVMVLDLKEKPWLCKPEELKAVHDQVMPELRKRTGVFHYEDEDEQEIRGRNWRPPPGSKWPGLVIL